MKYNWQPSGIYENRYEEAYCSKCNRQECAGADFCDADKIDKFWKTLNKLNDCKKL